MEFDWYEKKEIKTLLDTLSDDELYEVFEDVYYVVKEKLEQIKKRKGRPPAEYSNGSPYGIAAGEKRR